MILLLITRVTQVVVANLFIAAFLLLGTSNWPDVWTSERACIRIDTLLWLVMAVAVNAIPLFRQVWMAGRLRLVIPLSETNSSHLKMDGWKTRFLLGWLPGRCYVSFRGCTPFKHSRCASSFKKGETKIKERWTKGTMLGVSFRAIFQQ